MPVSLYRIDDRLIHGQVVIGWGQPLGIRMVVLVDDDRESVHGITIYKDIQLDQVVGSKLQKFIIQRRIPARATLQPVVEIEHDLCER